MLHFSFSLGDGTVTTIQSDIPYDLNVWHTVEFGRNGKVGWLKADNRMLGEAESEGESESFSIAGDIYLGGYPNKPPYLEVSSAVNFSGCVKDFFLNLDRPDLRNYKEALNTREGCQLEVRNTQLITA